MSHASCPSWLISSYLKSSLVRPKSFALKFTLPALCAFDTASNACVITEMITYSGKEDYSFRIRSNDFSRSPTKQKSWFKTSFNLHSQVSVIIISSSLVVKCSLNETIYGLFKVRSSLSSRHAAFVSFLSHSDNLIFLAWYRYPFSMFLTANASPTENLYNLPISL